MDDDNPHPLPIAQNKQEEIPAAIEPSTSRQAAIGMKHALPPDAKVSFVTRVCDE